MKRFLLLFFGLSGCILLVFALSGEAIETWFDQEKTIALLEQYSWFAGPFGAGVLISDLILPIPTTLVIGGMGAVLGSGEGTLWGWVGLNLSAWLGYLLAGWKGAQWAGVSEQEQDRFSRWFNRTGGWAVMVSRWLPILPEVISIMAGMYGMSAKRFGIAVALGSLPPAWMYAWIGATARETPTRSVLLLIGTTLVAWLVLQRMGDRPEDSKKG